MILYYARLAYTKLCFFCNLLKLLMEKCGSEPLPVCVLLTCCACTVRLPLAAWNAEPRRKCSKVKRTRTWRRALHFRHACLSTGACLLVHLRHFITLFLVCAPDMLRLASQHFGCLTRCMPGSVIGNFSPLPDDTTELKNGDLVKMCDFFVTHCSSNVLHVLNTWLCVYIYISAWTIKATRTH